MELIYAGTDAKAAKAAGSRSLESLAMDSSCNDTLRLFSKNVSSPRAGLTRVLPPCRRRRRRRVVLHQLVTHNVCELFPCFAAGKMPPTVLLDRPSF